MKKYLMTLCLVALNLGYSLAQQPVQWPEVTREMKAGSRWWWHGSAVDKDNLKWNMEQYAQVGIGTLEITPIYSVKNNASNNITFLSPKWLEMLKYTKQLGEQLDIDIDMTTGTGWPFGGPMVKQTESASKLVTETFNVTGDGTTSQALTLNTSNGALQKVMAFPQNGNSGQVTDLTSLVSGKSLSWVAPTGQWQVIAAYNQYGVMQVKRPSPGSEGFVVDYFDSTAVANYLKYFDTKFSAGDNVWPHSFFNDSYEITQADWTPRMFEEFVKRRGYKLEDNLDKFLSNDKQIIADYRQTLSDMLLDNFTRQWTKWAHDHGVTTRNQAHGSPGNLIDLYAAADIPEIENFYLNSFGINGLRNDLGFYKKALSSKATLKYASSAAHITGKPLTSSESMTWLTEHFRTSLSQIKPELDLLFTSGVNHVLFHGTTYSPREATWPGWKFYAAIDMSPTNSIWHDAPSMMKYIERVQSFMQMGQPDNDVLVYAPFAYTMKTKYATFANRLLLFDINTMSSKMSELETCVNNLETMGLDCDYTSERFLMTTNYVDGLLKTAAGTTYKALVVPVSSNLPDSVKVHLEELTAAGATVVYGNTIADLGALNVKPEGLRAEYGLSVIRRSNEHGHHYFIANLTPDDVEGFVDLSVPFTSVAFFDPMTGDIAKGSIENKKVWVQLKSGQSVILQTFDNDISLAKEKTPVHGMKAIVIHTPWRLSFTADSKPQMTDKSYELDQLQTWETLDAETAYLMGTGVYETTFRLTARQVETATGGFLIDLGDVRESARVWLNGEYLGCAWAAPFELNCGNTVKEGENVLKIEVTNLPANRIRQMDKSGTEWRIFEDINMSNISTASYAGWSLVPSGLNSSVSLIPLTVESNTLDVVQIGMVKGTDDDYYPEYRVSIPGDKPVKGLSMTDKNGAVFNEYTIQDSPDGSKLMTIQGLLGDNALIVVTDENDVLHYGYVPALGAYAQQMALDFTITPDLGSWDKMSNRQYLKGYESLGKLDWYRSKKGGKENELYDGVNFASSLSNYYWCFVGYGINAPNDFQIKIDNAKLADICIVGYMRGDGMMEYNAKDSLLLISVCNDEAQGLGLTLAGSKSYQVYRSLAVYRPKADVTAVKLAVMRKSDEDAFYTLQGQRVAHPAKGVYIKNGKKIVYK